MTDSTKYYIWLSLGLGFCSAKPMKVHSLYPDIKTLYDGGEREFRYCGIFTESEINRLNKFTLKDAESIIGRCRELSIDVVDISEKEYPERLREIDDPPCVLYISGKIPDVDSLPTVSVVGTRKATVYGVKTAFELGANLSRKGFVVVSGGALGIDCAAHRGVLQSEGVTVCVLGCGIDYDYLRENKIMRNQIAINGAVISEYPPGSSPAPRNFPQRNRIISGLAQGVIIVEAPKASGSMITVNLALSQSRDVFAVMGNVDSFYSEGSNMLIKEGAIPVTSYKDVYEYYFGVDSKEDCPDTFSDVVVSSVPTKLRKDTTEAHSQNHPVKIHRKDIQLTDEEKAVYYLIDNEPRHIDYITEHSSLPAFKVIRIISALELSDLISNVGSKNYILK
ncbi:MAG: DNA-processing protein DprA [Ruminococcus sp.]